MPFNLADTIQKYVAITSVGPSTVRGYPSGTTEAARAFLQRIDLRRFGADKERAFIKHLAIKTDQLRLSLPPNAKSWGLARKVLNIFLHNAFYNHYLRRQFRLGRAERFFEVPMDLAVSKGLRRGTQRGQLPTWNGIKRLRKEDHEIYQQRALDLAKEIGTTRVHLDALLWVQER